MAAGFLPVLAMLCSSCKKGFSSMLKYYVKTTEALKRLRSDNDGVVSFEYVIVAVCIIAAVIAAFGTTNQTGIGAALTNGITKVTNAFTAVP
jgi:pilus assembly protein Flp/PilA